MKKITAAIQKLLGSNEPAIVGGLLAAAGVALVYYVTGDFDDGISGAEWGAMIAPVLASIGIRQAVTPAAKAGKAVRRR